MMFLRTFVFLCLAIFLLPIILGAEGIWLAVAMAEFMALVVTFFYFIKYRKVYNYI